MKFEEVAVQGAEGALLAHSHRLGGAKVLKKGRRLSADDCRALAAAGIARVTVARLEAGDVGEDAVSTRVAEAVRGPHVRLSAASTGRTNLFAERRGLLLASRERVDAVNLVDEAITVATLTPFAVVDAGEMIATVKVIPFAAPEPVVSRACDRARGSPPVLSVAPFARKRAGLVLTFLPGIRDEVLERAAQHQRVRMSRVGGDLAREVRVAHDVPSVARAIDGLLRAGDLDVVFLLGASAIVDRKDVVPAAVEAAGGAVDHLGMPVDPGNLLLLAHLGRVPIVGVPGCARSLDPSGFDWVLERIAADVPIGREDIMRLGAGGLLIAPSRRRAGEPSAD